MTESDTQSDNPKTSSVELQHAIENARILLSYASEKGMPLAEADIKYIVASWNNEKLSKDDEINFWIQYSQLAATVSPATVESISAMSHNVSGDKTQIEKTLRVYIGMTRSLVFLLVILQAYWTFGNSVIDDIKQIDEQLLQIAEKKETHKTEKADENQKNLEFEKGTDYEMLKFWLSQVVSLNELNSTKGEVSNPIKKMKSNIMQKKIVIFLLSLLQLYILPIICGLLGTCVYILRDLSFKIKNCAFTEAAKINFRIRLLIGSLAGTASAWILGVGKASDQLTSLPPLAVAFLVGYSIEILFSVMDAFIGNFIGKKFTSATK